VFSKFFDRQFYLRFAPYIFAVAVLAVPVLLYGVRGALRGGNNDVRQWLPKTFQETAQYDWFVAHFGSEEMAVVSWPSCAVDDPRLQRVAEALQPYVEPAPAAEASSNPRLFKRVLTSSQALSELTGEPMKIPRTEAIRRLSGLLIGPDGKTGALVVMVNAAGAASRSSALATIREATESAGISAGELRVAGPTVDSVALDSESQRSRYFLAAIAFTIAAGLAWRCLGHLRLVAMVFATAILSAALNVAIVYFMGGSMNLLMGMMPSLVYLLVLSAAIHLVNYYRQAVQEGSGADSPWLAAKRSFVPCLLCSGTTAVGLGSLVLSEVEPVSTFGVYSAIGVMTSIPVLYLLLPSLLQWWPVHEFKTEPSAAKTLGRTSWTTRLSDLLIAHHGKVVAGSLALMAVGCFGVARLDTSVKLLNLFSPSSRIIQDYTWMERHVGPMVPIELVLRFPHENSQSIVDRLELVKRVEGKLRELEKVGGTMSAATFAPEPAAGRGGRQLTQRVLFKRRLEQQRDYLYSTQYLRAAEAGELWRISARVEALNSIDYGQFIVDIKNAVEPILQESKATGGGVVEPTYTGIVPLVYKAQRTLLNDLAVSFVSAFLLIGAAMACLVRGILPGLVSMIPNIFPAVIAFGAMGISGTLCDIGSMMTAGAAMGIAVDDTIHFLSHFRSHLAAGRSRRDAIRLSYDECAAAMVQSSVVCAFGLLVFALSAFVPTARFAWLMSGMLLLALLADLILLPALLAGPLGSLFMLKSRWTFARRSSRPMEVTPVDSSSSTGDAPVGQLT